jgi:hypothetical protein
MRLLSALLFLPLLLAACARPATVLGQPPGGAAVAIRSLDQLPPHSRAVISGAMVEK